MSLCIASKRVKLTISLTPNSRDSTERRSIGCYNISKKQKAFVISRVDIYCSFQRFVFVVANVFNVIYACVVDRTISPAVSETLSIIIACRILSEVIYCLYIRWWRIVLIYLPDIFKLFSACFTFARLTSFSIFSFSRCGPLENIPNFEASGINSNSLTKYREHSCQINREL